MSITFVDVVNSHYYKTETFVNSGRGTFSSLEHAIKTINLNAPSFISPENIKNNKDKLINLTVMLNKTKLTAEERELEILSAFDEIEPRRS